MSAEETRTLVQGTISDISAEGGRVKWTWSGKVVVGKWKREFDGDRGQVAECSAAAAYSPPSPSVALFSQNSIRSISRIPQKTKNDIMARLPPELWIIILDMVVEEGIVRLDQCDYNTFPYDHVFLSSVQYHPRFAFYRSHWRLRLVCRSFNALLGTQPHCDLHPSTFPFPTSTRALCITPNGLSLEPVFQQLLADTRRCERLVCLEVSFCLPTSYDQPKISDFFSAAEEGAFPNVQNLTLWLRGNCNERLELPFWNPLRRGFTQLVTLSVQESCRFLVLDGETEKPVTFERLEILCFGGPISCLGCYFPRLRHASIDSHWNTPALEIFQRSSNLESLIMRSTCATFSIDVRSFSRLHVLSLPEGWLQEVVPLDCDHPLEHLWLYLVEITKNPGLIEEIVRRIPRILRITMDFSSVTPYRRTKRIQEFKRMRLDSFGLALRPIKLSDTLLIIE